MCAAETLMVNNYGYPALILKIFNFIASGAWLITELYRQQGPGLSAHREQNIGCSSLSRPLFLYEAIVQCMYFLELHPNVITSAAVALFSTEENGLGSGLASFSDHAYEDHFLIQPCPALIANGIYFYPAQGQVGISVFSFLAPECLIVSG